MEQRTKVIVFVAILTIAAAVATHALLRAPASCKAGQTCVVLTGQNRIAIDDSDRGNGPAEPAAAVCDINLSSLTALNKLPADTDAAFVLLPGGDEQKAGEAAQQISDALEEISATEVRVGSFTMGQESNDYEMIVRNFSIESFPSVLILRRGCRAVAVTGKITKEKLHRAFIMASTPSGPGGRTCEPSSCAQ